MVRWAARALQDHLVHRDQWVSKDQMGPWEQLVQVEAPGQWERWVQLERPVHKVARAVLDCRDLWVQQVHLA